MHIVRFVVGGSDRVRVGVLDERGIATLPVDSLGALLSLRVDEIRSLVEGASGWTSAADVRLVAPVDGRTEVWGAGVTYERSREARVEESVSTSVYETVYAAERPELFLKSVAWRVTTDDQPAGVRADAADSVPEPELALVLNRHGEIVGATVCDDLTARSVEGENPLYLPQAKIYTGSCVLAARIRAWWDIPTPENLDIRMRVLRGDDVAFAGQTSTARLHRPFAELVDWLFREIELPEGAVLATGTGIVPPLGQGLRPGDRVEIEIDEVGRLTHPVVTAAELRP